MTYQEALAYLYSFSDFERSGVFTRNADENIPREARLLELLGNPQKAYTTTHIAGTKGKGSTAACIERVLRQAGVRTGLYTQPDLHTFRERMRIRGRLISEAELAQLVPEVRVAVEHMTQRREFGPFITYEVATALMFLYFARQHVQHGVIEVGLGGRLDATNVIHPLVSVITSISYDHMQILGNTLAQIATEKAGIIKQDGVVVTSAQSPEALLAIAAVAHQRHATLIRVGAFEHDSAQEAVAAGSVPPLSYRYRLEEQHGEQQRFTIWTPRQTYKGLEIPLVGLHQLENATAALAALEVLRERGLAWTETALREGLQAVRWPARVEVLAHNPTLVVDGAHNADSMHHLMETVRQTFSPQRLIIVLSVARDKDLVGIVRELADVDRVILTTMHNARAADDLSVEAAFQKYAPNVQITVEEESGKAMDRALALAEKDDLICATGSLYLAAEVLRWAAAHGNTRARSEIEGVDHYQ